MDRRIGSHSTYLLRKENSYSPKAKCRREVFLSHRVPISPCSPECVRHVAETGFALPLRKRNLRAKMVTLPRSS